MRIIVISTFLIHLSSLIASEGMIFNVGNGNCVVVKDNDQVLLCDVGSKCSPKPQQVCTTRQRIADIASYIIEGPAKKLCIVVSHGDIDHYGWVPLVVDKVLEKKKFLCKMLLGGNENDYTGKNAQLAALLKIKKRLEESTNNQERGRFVSEIGNNNRSLVSHLPKFCEILTYNTASKDPNANSVVLFVPALSFLILADATGELTKQIITKLGGRKPQVILAAHHGSSTHGSNSVELLSEGSKYIVASAGLNKKYKVPSRTFVENALESNAEVCSPHPITFFGDTLESKDRIKCFMRFNDGRQIAVTNSRLLNTHDAGDIRIIKGDNDEVRLILSNELYFNTFADCMVREFEKHALDGMLTEVDLTNAPIEDKHLEEIASFPPALKRLVLDGTKLTPNFVKRAIKMGVRGCERLKLLIAGLGFKREALRSIALEGLKTSSDTTVKKVRRDYHAYPDKEADTEPLTLINFLTLKRGDPYRKRVNVDVDVYLETELNKPATAAALV